MLGYYAGLLHDIGKLNPFYQEYFRNGNTTEAIQAQLEKTYGRIHAPYSAWIAKKILINFTKKQLADIIILIYKHHGALTGSLGNFKHDNPNTRICIGKNFTKFAQKYKNLFDSKKIDWNIHDHFFSRPMTCDADLEKNRENFFRIGFLFSALLQADKGSFDSHECKKFNIDIDTKPLEKPSPLSHYRTEIQKNIIKNYDPDIPISVINAPTGAGKTKAFLDIIEKYGKNYSRIFYFSPLLALTEDFESKIIKCISSSHLQDILKYNSVTIDTLDTESTEGTDQKWNFDYESLNKNFVITTLQRLLITIYSPKNKDKLKLASFRDSLLIIDEIQTVPSEILGHLISQLHLVTKHLKSKVLLVSATIPYELNDLPKASIPENITTEYLDKTAKQISVSKKLEICEITDERYMMMFNTRRKTVDTWNTLQDKNTTYITAGLTKKDKMIRINQIKNYKRVISTQSIEAGVDISFSRIYREMAPLDSIVQVLGRLNRENDENNSLLTVFETDGQHMPYSKIEYHTSKKYLQNVTNSKTLYDILPKYYEEIYTDNMESRDQSELISSNANNMNFKKVWEIVRGLSDDYYDNVFVPDPDEWNSTKDALMKKQYGAVNKFTATLPTRYDKIGSEYFDEELLDMHILLPKKDKINELYDPTIGLDRWLIQ